MYSLTLDLPNLDKGAEVELDGLGVFKNGETHEISDEDAENFRMRHQTQKLVKVNKKTGASTYEEVPGPTLVEAFADHPSIKVVEAKVTPRTPRGGTNND